jgi:glycosyltransferase involved in cell wall biosynthesis
MSEMTKGKVTLCIVNYKTLFLTMMCLRSIRKFTRYPYEVIVIDNDSQDESLDYLKSLKWIRLIERRIEPGSRAGDNHAAALDLGLTNCSTEFFASMHSDIFITEYNWLSDLVGYFNNDENTACVGSGKIEIKPKWQIFLKNTFDLQLLEHKLFKKPDPKGRFRHYNRTTCCLYRTEVLLKENLSFLMDNNCRLTPGKKLYFEIIERGYKTVELPSSLMCRYMIHVGHATQVINSEDFLIRKKTIRKGMRKISKISASRFYQDIYADSSLDQ